MCACTLACRHPQRAFIRGLMHTDVTKLLLPANLLQAGCSGGALMRAHTVMLSGRRSVNHTHSRHCNRQNGATARMHNASKNKQCTHLEQCRPHPCRRNKLYDTTAFTHSYPRDPDCCKTDGQTRSTRGGVLSSCQRQQSPDCTANQPLQSRSSRSLIPCTHPSP